MTERIINGNGIRIWTESFGDPNDVPLLLIMGASAQGIYWPEHLVQKFVDQGRFVIRYDNRDTGQSTCFDMAANPYTLDDLSADAVAILDAYGIDKAHVAGASMGGMIAQLLAINFPERLLSATLIMSSPISGGGGEIPELGAEDLPSPDPEWMAMAMANMSDPENREARIEQRVKMFEILAGSAEPFNDVRQRDIATREVDRLTNFAAMNNHAVAIAMSQPSDRRELLAKVELPVLVVHGTEDPILPYPHGVSLADSIPGAELMTLDRAGHEMPDIYMDEMVAKIIALGI